MRLCVIAKASQHLILTATLLISLATYVSTVGDRYKCKDQHIDCQSWATRGECEVNPYFMRVRCSQSCHACPSSTSTRPWRGYATELGTRKYAAALPGMRSPVGAGHFRKDISMGSYDTPGQAVRGSPWLTLSSIGTGTYLGNEDDETDHQVTCAIILSIFNAMNVIDTASNYRGGRGQLSVGQAVRALMQSGKVDRTMLFFSTKAGFVDPDLTSKLLARWVIQQEDIVGGASCIHPACLEASLRTSLEDMHLETVDLLYLHNIAEMHTAPAENGAMYKRLRRAFKWLEQARAKGRIKAYGMATWSCFRTPLGSEGHVSLQEIVHIAREIGGLDHGFRYVQLPINAGMMEAVTEPWQVIATEAGSRRMSFLKAASELGVGVFASGPLGEGSLLRNERLQSKLRSSLLKLATDTRAGQLLQLVRSTPLLVGAVVGHKRQEHVRENIKLAHSAVLDVGDFKAIVSDLAV